MWQTIGHDWAVDLLAHALRNDRLAHAYLFVGLEQIGKGTLASEFAAALNCTGSEPPCSNCAACRKTVEGTHPDVAVVVPQNGKIKIEQIRELQRQVALSPYEGRTRVCIIRDIHTATIEAENALLKTLEEPPSRLILLLTATSQEVLLPTVVSRCQVLPLRPVPVEMIHRHMVEKEGQTQEQAALISRWSGGRIGWAIAMARDASLLDVYRKRMESIHQLLGQGRVERMRMLESLSKRSNLRDTLQVWQLWWRDVILIATANEAWAINADQTETLRTFAHGYGLVEAVDAYKGVGQALEMLDQNVNPRLVLEGLVLNWRAPRMVHAH